ncbi:MAG TPA: hypothetical protein VFV38_27400 [Ktedonobacteraceae bacterium]|nr:hypothetical protein [Ktedonobacteraceae bacterium]
MSDIRMSEDEFRRHNKEQMEYGMQVERISRWRELWESYEQGYRNGVVWLMCVCLFTVFVLHVLGKLAGWLEQ